MTSPPARRTGAASSRPHAPSPGGGQGIAALPAALAGGAFRLRAAVALLAGALSVLAMAPFFLSPVLALTLPALVWLIDAACARDADGRCGRGWRSAAAMGWFFGFGYFLFGLFWIGEAFLVEADKFAWLLPVAVTVLPAGLALFVALAAGLASRFWSSGLARVLVLAVALGGAEWLRGHVLTGLPWNVLGYALTHPLTLMQSAGLVGIYGLTLVTVLVFALPLVALAEAAAGNRSRRIVVAGLGVPVLLVAALWSYGAFRLSQASDATVPGVRFRIVQPSILQTEKWRPEKQLEIFKTHLDLSRSGVDGREDALAGITHVVWPEAAMPFFPLESPQALSAIADLLPDGVHLLSGALRIERAGASADAAATPAATPAGSRRRVFNSLIVFGPDAAVLSIYDKIHLVPFGEYLPFQEALESIGLEQLTRMRGGFDVGPAPRPLVTVPGLPAMTGLICYEGIFPAAVVQSTARPGLLINVTNDGWFGNTTGPRQHFHMSRLRAVEEGVPLIRAANNGISAMIDPFGRILQRLDLNAKGVIDTGLPAAIAPPPYARTGDQIFFLMMLLAAGVAWVTARAEQER